MSRNGGSSGSLDCKVYVGGLSREASREEIERAFGHYGKIKNTFVARNPPGFAFVEFDDAQDAEDAVRALDGRSLCGTRVRVEISHGKSRHKGPARKPYGGGGGGRRSRSRSVERDRRRRDRSNSSKNRSSSEDRGAKYREPARERDRDSNGRRRPTHSAQRSRSRS